MYLPFTSASSYSVFDTTTVSANSKGFAGGVYDGKYAYCMPFNNGSSGQVTRILAYQSNNTNKAAIVSSIFYKWCDDNHTYRWEFISIFGNKMDQHGFVIRQYNFR